nr:hypothetical protein [Tanacetum cinerariifolium]
MANSAIIVSFDSFDESVGSPPSQFILFGDIPAVIPFISMVAPETSTTTPIISSAALMVGTTLVASPTGLCGLVASHPSSSSEYPIALIVAPLRARRPPATLVRPREAIPFGRPYCTHPNGPRSPSSGSAPVPSLGFVSSDQAHSGPSTRVVSPRLDYPLVRAPQLSEAFRRWCVAPLSTFYPPTMLESSSGDSLERPRHSSLLSARPSRKRCRSPADSIPSSTPVTRSLAPTRADLLPPRKRELAIVDGDDVRDQVEVDPKDDREEFDASAGDTIVLRIDPRSVPRVDEEIVAPVGGDSSSLFGTRDGTVRQLEVDQMIASIETTSMDESIRSLRSENLKVCALLCIERDRVDSLRLHVSRPQEEFRQIRDDRDDLWRSLRRLESFAERRLGFRP